LVNYLDYNRAMNKKYYLYFAWAVAIVATLGSFYLGEVLGLTPCPLCWYQRLAMWPLVLLLGLAVFKQAEGLLKASLILSLVGLAVAFYHNWIYYQITSDYLLPCSLNAPCAARQFAWFGFIDIPQLSLAAFMVVVASLIAYRRNHN